MMTRRPYPSEGPHTLDSVSIPASAPGYARPARLRRPTRAALTGAQWLQVQSALDDSAPFSATLRATAELAELKPQLRHLLHYHCGVSTLRTRQLMLDLQSL